MSKKLILSLVFIFAITILTSLFFYLLSDRELKIKDKTTVICIDSEIEKSIKDYVRADDTSYSCTSYDIRISRDKDMSFKTVSEYSLFHASIINLENNVDGISEKELLGIFSETITNWQDVGGKNEEIKVYALDSSENAELLKKTFLIADYNFERVDSGSIINKIQKEKSSIAFVPLSFLDARVKTLKVDKNSPFKNQDDYIYKKTYFVQTKKDKDYNVLSEISKYFKDQGGDIIEIVAVGDIMLSRHVGTKIRQAKDNALPFRKIYDILSGADITFGNLESPFYDKGSPVTAGMVFKAEPEMVEGLKFAGFDIVSLANNHFGDQRREGMEFTLKHLSDNGIYYCGAGNNYKEAHEYKTIETKGRKISFLSYNEISPESYRATPEKAGLAWISTKENDLLQMEKDIRKAKENSDFVFTSFHWGIEYTSNPTENQKIIAQRAISAGADIIVSQHPHVVQAIDFFDSRPVFYSLGNFVFDQMWSQETREGLIVKIYLQNDKLKSFDFLPVVIEDYNQPRLADEKEARSIKNRIFNASDF